MTRDPRPAIFSSSPSVLTCSRPGDDAAPVVPSICAVGSKTLVTFLAVSRSYQSLPTMPERAGIAPESMVACPIAVTEG